MTKEIKEILEILKKCYDFKDENFDNYISLYQLGLLLDYITNLQQENERLKYHYHSQHLIHYHSQHLIELLNEDIEMYKNELNILQNGSEKDG